MAPLTVFCGKGGVGKTTLSLAYGYGLALRGKRTLVVSSHPIPELALSVSLRGLREKSPEAAANLFVLHIEPRELIADSIRRQLRPALLARAVLSSRLYQNLVEVAPGLKEIALLARLRQLAVAGHTDDPRYDALIWDAPASGHFLQTLRSARSFDRYMTGPFSSMAQELAGFISGTANLRIIPVATLEEMAVVETVELCESLLSDHQVKPVAVVCNMVSPLLALPREELPSIAPAGPDDGDAQSELRSALDRHEEERGLFEELRRSVGVPIHLLERVPSWSDDLELLEKVASMTGSLALPV